MFCTPEKAALPLERCMRFLPQHNDTGGFFVAVLEKVAPLAGVTDPEMGFKLRSLAAMGRAGEEGGEAAAAEELKAAASAAAAYALEVGFGLLVAGNAC
jgi:hypothetical protein